MAHNSKTISTTGTVKFIRSGFQRNYDTLNKMIGDWYLSLAGEGRLCLAISRKAPRLLEWCKQEFGDQQLHVVSELALPFVDMRNYHTCTVVDEAIYNGTTFSKVLSIANCLNNSEYTIQAYPVVLTSTALENTSIMEKLVSTHRIEKRDTHFFIDAIVSKFLTLGKSYDLEHPIFYIDFKENIEDNQDVIQLLMKRFALVEQSKRNLANDVTYWYKTDTYSREMNRVYSSYTYLANYLYQDLPEAVRPEFAKLRFFVKGNRLSIVSMSPFALNDSYLKPEVQKFELLLDRVWRYIHSASQTINPDVDSDEYKYQRQKSLVVLMNYLLAFAQFLSVRDSLQSAINDLSQDDFKLAKDDLVYLLGENVGEKVYVMLEYILSSHLESKVLLYPTCLKDGAVIPYKYADDYRFWMNIDNLDQRTLTLSQMLSNQFSAMHWYVELPSRSSDPNFNRLRFGESYSSLYERYQAYFKQDIETRRLVNKAIDSRIDRGSVVPNYVRQEGALDAYWTRLFRSGENEDYFKDQILRIVLHIFQAYCDKLGGSIMPNGDLQLILGLIATLGECTKGKNPINILLGRQLSVRFDQSYNFLVKLEDSEENLIDYAVNNKVLVKEDNFLRLADSTYAHELTLGIPMSKGDEEILDSFIDYVCMLREDAYNKFDLHEILNYLMYSSSRFEDSLHAFYYSLRKIMEQDLSYDFREYEMQYMNLYQRLPEPFLPIPIGDNLPEKVRDGVKKIMVPLREMLQTQRQFDKLQTAYYIYNVWSEVRWSVSSQNFGFDHLDKSFHYLSEMNAKFSDATSIHSWIMENDNFAKLHHYPIDKLKERLLELLSIIQ